MKEEQNGEYLDSRCGFVHLVLHITGWQYHCQGGGHKFVRMVRFHAPSLQPHRYLQNQSLRAEVGLDISK